MSNTNVSIRKGGSKPSILHYFSKAALPKRTKASSKPIRGDEPIMSSSSAMTPLPSSATPFNPNLPPPSSAATPASVSSEESMDSPSLGEVTIESSSQQQHDKKLMSSSATPTTILHDDNDTPRTPPTPPSTHALENDDVETPPSPDSQVSSTPCTPPTPESEQPTVIWNRKRRQPQDVMTTGDNSDGETPQSLLERYENDDNDEYGYQLQRQNITTTATKTPSIGVSSFHTKSSTASTRNRTTSISSSKRRRMSNAKRSIKSLATPKQPISKKKKKKNSNQQQLFLDFGQSSFGKRTVCSICGMMRVHGVAEDDIQHAKICKDYKEGVTCLGWKNERQVEEFFGSSTTKKWNDRILEVREGDALQHRKKVLDVKRIVDGELGFAVSSSGGGRGDGDDVEVEEDPLNGLTSYLYVSNKRIVGLLLVKRIQRAYQVVVPKHTNTKTNDNSNNKANDVSSSSFSISRSLKPSRALLGVHQIWVHSSHRNKGIASKLVTAARDHLIFGMMVPLELVAFSSPTMEGLRFAKSYLGVERPLVYDIN
eukprot:CAMPEP_0201722986 /NCGR_PEP_ID=MMETSP0593-20130828/7166_1 /ASSEMBLY_ACC=CAM_ASM_000672 /TAXON_ID=267983 /ORGANISM="Skeletonema japonicum, Strain CCMP2506" /LENGTH=540 /DNA_ID=CAMNT_0048214013 /DNA_START=9 /DNA_END=1631 /DNA_ORIENTATION=-